MVGQTVVAVSTIIVSSYLINAHSAESEDISSKVYLVEGVEP